MGSSDATSGCAGGRPSASLFLFNALQDLALLLLRSASSYFEGVGSFRVHSGCTAGTLRVFHSHDVHPSPEQLLDHGGVRRGLGRHRHHHARAVLLVGARAEHCRRRFNGGGRGSGGEVEMGTGVGSLVGARNGSVGARREERGRQGPGKCAGRRASGCGDLPLAPCVAWRSRRLRPSRKAVRSGAVISACLPRRALMAERTA